MFPFRPNIDLQKGANMEDAKKIIRDIPDFPKEGIIFKDITPLLGDPVIFQKAINAMKERYINKMVDVVVGVEVGVVMVRKPGKLPYKTFQETYSLEYGTDTIEVHQDAFRSGQNILIIDDVLATGGTLAATLGLIQKNFDDVKVVEAAFLIELDFLKGREKLKDTPVHAMIHY